MQTKSKTQILSIALSVFVSVFLVAGIVYAAITISSTTITFGNGETIDNTTDGTIAFVSDAGTISGEIHGINLTHTGTLSSGDGMVGINTVVTTAGENGAWASGIFARVAQDSTKHVVGYISGAEFEVYNEAANVSAWFPLVLNAWNNAASAGGNEAYIALRDYGTTPMANFLSFPDVTIGAGKMIAARTASSSSHTLRIMVGGTAYYIMLSSAQ